VRVEVVVTRHDNRIAELLGVDAAHRGDALALRCRDAGSAANRSAILCMERQARRTAAPLRRYALEPAYQILDEFRALAAP
jgi:hypothetical protein